MSTNPTWVLKRFPAGMPQNDDFELVERAIRCPSPANFWSARYGCRSIPTCEARLGRRTTPPGRRRRDDGGRGGVGEVIASESSDFRPGDIVMADDFGWQPLTTVKARTAMRLDPSAAPVQTSLGCLGMPGLQRLFLHCCGSDAPNRARQC